MRALLELRKIHEGKGYSDEQLHVWAFMIAQGRADVVEPTKERFFGAESSKAKKSAGASLATSDSTQRNKGDNGSMMARLEKREFLIS